MNIEPLVNKLVELSEKTIEHYGRLTGMVRQLKDHVITYIKEKSTEVINVMSIMNANQTKMMLTQEKIVEQQG